MHQERFFKPTQNFLKLYIQEMFCQSSALQWRDMNGHFCNNGLYIPSAEWIKGLWLNLMIEIRPKWQGLRYWHFKQWIFLYFYHTWNQSKYLLSIHGFLANISNRIISAKHHNPAELEQFQHGLFVSVFFTG